MNIVGLGSIAMDTILNVDVLPKEDAFCVIKSTRLLPGGSGANVIVQASRLGASCGFIAKIGNDMQGKELLRVFDKETIDHRHMVVQDSGTTLHTDIVVDETGGKFIMLDMGDCFLNLKTDEVDYSYISNADVFYTDLMPYSSAYAGLRAAKQAGLKTAFNMQVGLPQMKGFGIDKQQILESLAYVDLFAPCREGLYQLCGTEDLDVCAHLLHDYCPGTLLFTLGSDGSVAYDPSGKKYRQEALSGNIIDTTGAGDSYMGAMLYQYLLQKRSLSESMEFAAICALLTCGGTGARSCPTLEAVNGYRA
ncbi:carbohydrate kinase family protein [uncultured Sphaerochaeta sp.]|uniref:carbohydrate kinase family protein n=1 Tax=uncultured Sphaerochaeta sp. TaxID=886478 RepID=UPI002A0A5606|nr:carbohydrate kinase family protein [uncultured Sphaerochaeta sp.]